MPVLTRRICGAGLLMLGAQSSTAQTPPARTLKPADARLERTFVSISTGNELADGRVIIIDPRQQILAAADLKTGKIEELSSAPNGPKSFPLQGTPYRLKGDSTLLIQPQSRQWVIISGGKVVAEIPVMSPMQQAAPLGLISVDAAGNGVASKRRPTGGVVSEGARDSSLVVWIARDTGREDTVASVYSAYRKPMPPGSPSEVYREYESYALSGDGWLAVVRLNPYRVDWRAPDGTWTLGKAIAVTAIPMSEAEKKAKLTITPSIGNAGGELIWPTTVPHVENGGRPLATPDGKLLVERTRTAAFPGHRWDIINRRGEVEGQLMLQAGEVIVGFGAHSIYLSDRIGTDKVQLVRHPWP